MLELGARPERLRVVGNLKYDMQVPPDLPVQAAQTRAGWGGSRPVWIAASTHEGEELAVIEAHSRLMRRFPDALMLVAPRHPERFKPMAQLCRSYGFATATRREDRQAGTATQCFVIDTLGELVPYLACADLAFIAGANGRPLTKESFGNEFKAACKEAGVQGSAHGVRKLAATRMADNGATETVLNAVFGWTDPRMAAHYTRTANRRRLMQGGALVGER